MYEILPSTRNFTWTLYLTEKETKHKRKFSREKVSAVQNLARKRSPVKLLKLQRNAPAANLRALSFSDNLFRVIANCCFGRAPFWNAFDCVTSFHLYMKRLQATLSYHPCVYGWWALISILLRPLNIFLYEDLCVCLCWICVCVKWRK